MDINHVSIIGQMAYSIRESLIKNQETLELPNGEQIKINPTVSIFTTFSIIQYKNDFHSLPKSILENFRIVNIISPDSQTVIKQYLLLLGFSIEQQQVYVRKIQFFFCYLSEQFLINIHKDLDIENTEISRQFTNFLNIKGIISVLKTALELIRV